MHGGATEDHSQDIQPEQDTPKPPKKLPMPERLSATDRAPAAFRIAWVGSVRSQSALKPMLVTKKIVLSE